MLSEEIDFFVTVTSMRTKVQKKSRKLIVWQDCFILEQQAGTLNGNIRGELTFSLMRVQRHLLNYGASRGGHRRFSCNGCLRVLGAFCDAPNPDVAGEYPRQTPCPTTMWAISRLGAHLLAGTGRA